MSALDVHERCGMVVTGTICCSNSRNIMLDSGHTNLLLLQAHDYSKNLGSRKLEDFDLIKTMPTKAHAAPTLPPHVEPILTLFPPEVDHEDVPMNPQQIMSQFS